MKKQFFNLLPGEETALIMLYGDIGYWDEVSELDVVRELDYYASQYSKIDVRINSYGGSVYSGIAIFNALRRCKADITLYIDGVAASIASFIALCGRPVYASKYSSLMIHNVSAGCYGNKDDMRSTLEQMEMLEDTLAGLYAERMNLTTDEFKAQYFDGKDHWLTAQQALDMHLITGLYDAQETENLENRSRTAVYNYYMAKAQVNTNNHNKKDEMKLEDFTRQSVFAHCKTEQEVLDVASDLANKAQLSNKLQDDVAALTGENKQLKDKLDAYEKKEQEAREQEIKDILDNAIKNGQIKADQREAYDSLLHKDFESTCAILNQIPRKKLVKDVLDDPEPPVASAWQKEQEKIQGNYRNRRNNR